MGEMERFHIDMLKVAQLSVEVFDRERRRKLLQGYLGAAYHRWKMLNGVDRVERETREWTRMAEADALGRDARLRHLAGQALCRAGGRSQYVRPAARLLELNHRNIRALNRSGARDRKGE